MAAEVTEQKQSRFTFPTAYIILVLLVVALLTFVIPAGKYDTDLNGVPIPGTYHTVESNPPRLLDTILAPINGMYGIEDQQGNINVYNTGALYRAIDVAIFILMIGGFLGLTMKTGAIDAGIAWVVKRLGAKGKLLIPILMIIFAVGGTSYGMAKESLAFYPLVIAALIALGYDAVTGSAYLVESKEAKVLIDCGMFQGGKKQEAKNRPPAQRLIKHLDATLITHAHLDHTGRLPLLVQRDLICPIFATPATIELTDIVRQDAARIQAGDAERINRKNQRAGLPPIVPLYTPEDGQRTLQLFKPAPCDESFEVAPGMSARFVEAGHLLGSVSIELTVEESGKRKVLMFSGDIGPRGKPLSRDAEPLTQADLVVMESTYGGRDHKSLSESSEEAIRVIQETLDQNGKILIPAFAIGRTQELLYALAAAFRNGRLPKFPIYIDSPMAVRSTGIYRRHRELFDEEALELARSGQLARELDHVTLIESA